MKITMKLMGPLSHGSFGPSSGNEVQIRRMTLVSAPGMPRVPCLSGNALRGRLRRLVMRDLLSQSNVTRDTLPSPGWDRLYAAIANGGHLDGSENRVDPEDRRRLREALPPLSLFGAALYSYMLPGHVDVGICWPRCKETLAAGLIEEGEDELRPAEDLVDEISHVRHADRDYQDPALTGVGPMPTTWEVLATGSVLECTVRFADHSTPAERGSFLRGLELLTTLGGKSSVGFGAVEVAHDGATADLQAYREWYLGDQAKAIRSLLAQMGPPKGKSKKARKK